MGFTSKECAWSQTSMKVLKRTVIGTRGWSFKYGIDKELLYAAGPTPIDIQSGNEKPEGSIKILKYELDMLEDASQLAGYKSILHVPHQLILITCAFKKLPTDPIRIIEAAGVGLLEWEVAQDQNAKFTEVTIPFIAIDITARKGGV